MKKLKAVPFQSLFDINDNMYQNIVVISKRSREIVSENVLDLNKLEEGFETTDEIEEIIDFDPNQEKSIVVATREFISNEIKWSENKTETNESN